MTARFSAPLLAALDVTPEITIHTAATPPAGVVIWVVVAEGRAYVRSYRGGRGRWFAGALAEPAVRLACAGHDIAARIAVVEDPAEIAAASAALARKYAASPYLGPMLREDVLATTLRLEPLPSPPRPVALPGP